MNLTLTTAATESLELSFDKPHPGMAFEVLDNALNPLLLTGPQFAGTKVPITRSSFNVFLTSVPDQDPTSLWIPTGLIGGIRIVALEDDSSKENVYLTATANSNAGRHAIPVIQFWQDVNCTAFTGNKFQLVTETENLKGMTRRMAGASIFAKWAGDALSNGDITAAAFQQSVLLPLNTTTTAQQKAGYLSSRQGSLTKSMNDGSTPGARSYYIPPLKSDWTDCMDTVHNNPWTGVFDQRKFYIWATRFIIIPTDVSKRVVKFSGYYVFEGNSDNKLFNYASSIDDPMWPVYRSALLNSFQISSNGGHWDHIKSAFNSSVRSVLDYGKSLLTKDNVEKFLKMGAEVAIPLIAGLAL
jgi:hypothetical protein